jgi:signal transduction histidine kinase
MEQHPGLKILPYWRKFTDAFARMSDRLYQGSRRFVSVIPVKISRQTNTVGIRLGIGIGTLLGSLLILGIFFSLQARFTSGNIQRLVTLQDPKADATYKMKITLMDMSFAVLNYLQDGEKLYLTRIAKDQLDFKKSYQLYMEMTQTREEKASGRKLEEEYAAWMRAINSLIRLRNEQNEKTQGFLKSLDRLAGLLNKKIQEETKQVHWVPSRKLQETTEMEIAIEELRKNATIFLTDPEAPYEHRIKKDVQDFTNHLRAYRNLTLTPKEQQWAKNLRLLFAKTRDATWEIMNLAIAEADRQEDFVRLRRQMDGVLNDQIQFPLEKSRAQARDKIQKKLSRATVFVFIFVLIGVFFGLGVAIITTKSITDPVARLMAGTDAVARGDLTYRVETESSDELGSLAESFNRMLEALQRNSQELERSNKELEEFAYAASHDLQEPLRKIANYAELLERRCKDQVDDVSKKYMATIIGGSTRMISLIHDLLSYSRISQDELVLTTVDMNSVVQQVISDLEVPIQESGAAISSDPLPTVRANPGQMEELFQNLISNAIKFRRPDPAQIHISAQRRSKVWKFSVKDNGIGIDPQHTKRLFLIFQRLHSRAEYPGTGIGLAICRKIVERHGGRIWVESELGKGATFHFILPLLPGKGRP